MTDVWGFHYTRKREVVWWLMVAKRCFKGDRFLVRYIARFLAYDIRLNFQFTRFTYGRSYSSYWPLIANERFVIASWMKNKRTVRFLARRCGKTEIIKSLAFIVSSRFKVLIVVNSSRVAKEFEICDATIWWSTKGNIDSPGLQHFDFIFAENVHVVIPQTDARVLILN